MRLCLNVPEVDSLEALLDLDPAVMRRLWLTTLDDDTLVFDHLEEIERVVNHRTRQVGLRVVGTHEDTDIDASVVVPLANIAEVEIELKASDEYDRDHRCTCTRDERPSSRGSRGFALDVPGLIDLADDLIDPIAEVIDGLKAQMPEHVADAIRTNLRRAAESIGFDVDGDGSQDNDSDDEAPSGHDVPIEGLDELPEELRSYVEDLVAGLDDGHLAGVKVVKVNPFAQSDEDGDSGDDSGENTDDTPSFADFASSLIDALSSVVAVKEAASSKGSSDEEKVAPESESESESNTDDVEPKGDDDGDVVEDKLAERADKLNAAFGGSSSTPAKSETKAAEAVSTKQAPEKTTKQTTPAEPKKLIDVKRGEGDRLFTGPNFTSTKNRLGPGRVTKLVETLEAARDGQKVTVGYRNTGRPGIVRGTGTIVHDFHDQGHRHTAKVGVRTSSFGASIVGPNGEIDPDLMELTLFEG